MEINYPKFQHYDLGKCVFVNWVVLDAIVSLWAKAYFGPHVKGTTERDETDAYINVLGLTEEDFPKYEALYNEHDPNNDFDPEEEFSPGDKHSFIPRKVLCNIVADALGAEAMPAAKSMIATPNGVFFMEKPRDGFYIE